MEEVLIVAVAHDRNQTVRHQISQQVATAISKELLYLDCSFRTPMTMMIQKIPYVSVMAVLQKLEREDMQAEENEEGKVQRLEAFLGHLHGVLVTSNPTATVNAMELAKEIEAFRKENP
jgi:hypothetical protein